MEDHQTVSNEQYQIALNTIATLSRALTVAVIQGYDGYIPEHIEMRDELLEQALFEVATNHPQERAQEVDELLAIGRKVQDYDNRDLWKSF